jgi:hypothetical protein
MQVVGRMPVLTPYGTHAAPVPLAQVLVVRVDPGLQSNELPEIQVSQKKRSDIGRY